MRQTARVPVCCSCSHSVIYREVAAPRTRARLVTRSCLCIPNPSDQSMAPAFSCSHWLHSHGLALIPLLGPGQEKQKPRELSVIQVRNPGPSPQNNTSSQAWPTSPGYPDGRTVWPPGISGGFLRRNRPLVDPDQRQGRKQMEGERRREMRERRQKTEMQKKTYKKGKQGGTGTVS